jgi:alkaline phosphatase D
MVAQLAGTADGAEVYSMDKWDGYVAARRKLIAMLAASRDAHPIVLTGDIHTNWVADLTPDFDNPRNPHVKFFNARRGYVRVAVTPDRWTTDFRVLPYVSRPGAPVETRATFVVERARRGAQRGR